MDEKQETEKQIDDLLQDLVQELNKIEAEWVKSPMHIRFGK